MSRRGHADVRVYPSFHGDSRTTAVSARDASDAQKRKSRETFADVFRLSRSRYFDPIDDDGGAPKRACTRCANENRSDR